MSFKLISQTLKKLKINHFFIHNVPVKDLSTKKTFLYELKLFSRISISWGKKRRITREILVWKIYLLHAVILTFSQPINVTTTYMYNPRTRWDFPIVWINLSHPSHDLSVKHTAPCDVYWLTQCVTPSSYWCLPVARYWCQFPREIYRTGNINFMKDLCSHVTCTISQHQSGEINPNFLNKG